MTDDEVGDYVRERLPDFCPTDDPVRLPEGNLNVVWRVPGQKGSVIVKNAPPHIAATPEVPLDPSRVLQEARCLAALGPDGRLSTIRMSNVRVPRVLDVNPDAHVLIMEDVGPHPTLGRWLRREPTAPVQERAPTIGAALGRFLGRLHADTVDAPAYAADFANRPMQETRHAVQYQSVGDMLEQGGIEDAEALGKRAATLGRSLLEPGRCLTMGDLWPPSVLVGDDTSYLIDWELSHYGRPLQDVAHVLAHLWMQAHRAPSEPVASAVRALRAAFLDHYTTALGDAADALWPPEEHRDAAIHFGAELLVRAVGPFQDGYLYEGLAPHHSAVQKAVQTAARSLRTPEATTIRQLGQTLIG